MRQTHRSHCHVCIISARVSIPVLFLSSSFEIVLGQYILRMCQRHLVWNTSSFCWIVTVVFQHSATYGRTLNTLLLNILILVWTLQLVALHTGFNTVIVTVVFQHSAPYGRMLNTLLLNILILVWTLQLVALHTGFNMVKAWLALLILVLVLWLQSPVVFQHSAPYGRMLNTLLLTILILVWTLQLVFIHTGFNMAKAWLALLILVLVLWLQSPVNVF